MAVDANATLGEKRLTTVHAVAQALAIGPMFSTALVLGGVSNPETGASFNAPLAVLVAMVGVLAIGYSLTVFARRYAGAGAVYEYFTHGASPSIGVFLAGVFVMGELCLAAGSAYLGIGILSHDFWAAHISDSAPSWWVFSLVAAVIVVGLNQIGIRIAIRAMLTFASVSFIPMVILAIAIIAQGGADGNTLATFNPATTSVSTVFSGVLLGILLFVGFEAAASIGEEAREPHRSIPRAVLITILISGLFYVLVAYAFAIGYGQSAVEAGKWAADPAYIDTLATRYVGSGLATVIDIVVILDAMGLALAICAVVARGTFALGRDRLLPAAFAKVSRFDTPSLGNGLVLVGAVGFVCLGAFSGFGHRFGLHPNELATFILVATIGSFVLELIYLALGVGALWLLWQARARVWSYLVVVVAIATPILAFKGALGPEPHDSSNLNWEAAFWALGIVAVAAVWFGVLWFTRRDAIRGAARHAVLRVGVPPLEADLGVPADGSDAPAGEVHE